MRNLISLLGLLVFFASYSQNNNVFVEVGGNGGIGSINYEHLFFEDRSLGVRVGVGISDFPVEESEPTQSYFDIGFVETKLTIPVSFQYRYNFENKSFLETGVGYTWQEPSSLRFESGDRAAHLLFLTAGYGLYFGFERNWFFKFNFSPIIHHNDGEKNGLRFDPWAGISVGISF